MKADVGTVEMESQRGVESQTGIAADDQKQLVERRDWGRQLGAIAQLSAAIDDRADPLGAKRLCEIMRRDHIADTVNPRDADRPKSIFRLAKLLGETNVPPCRQIHVFVNAHKPIVPGVRKAAIQSGRRASSVGKRDDIMRPADAEAARGQEVGDVNLTTREASHEGHSELIVARYAASHDSDPWSVPPFQRRSFTRVKKHRSKVIQLFVHYRILISDLSRFLQKHL
jgi:hypothetical protein